MAAVLDEQGVHKRLVQDLPLISEVSGVPQAMFARSATEFCTESEVSWLRNFGAHRVTPPYGAYVEWHDESVVYSVETRFTAMAACLMRNFIDARVMTLNQVLRAIEDKADLRFSVMLCPNFFVLPVSQGKPLTGWQLQSLYDVLMQRRLSARMTVLGVEHMEGVSKLYGESFRSLVSSFVRI